MISEQNPDTTAGGRNRSSIGVIIARKIKTLKHEVTRTRRHKEENKISVSLCLSASVVQNK
jgi:hypothetical protein